MFVDTTPTGPESSSADAPPEVKTETPESKKSPYSLVVSVGAMC